MTEAILSDMLEPRHRWRFPDPVTIPEALAAEAGRAGLSGRVVEVLVRRGLLDPAELRSFLGDPRDALHDPRLLPDADRFAARIKTARDRGEGILVFGDFDADGLSGLATLTLALRRFYFGHDRRRVRPVAWSIGAAFVIYFLNSVFITAVQILGAALALWRL